MGTLKLYLVVGAGLALLSITPSAARAGPVFGVVAAGQSQEIVQPAAVQARQEADATKELKLKFDAADLDRSGTLTQVEARRAGFAFVAVHFNLIDTARRGAVNFDEVMRFMRHLHKEPVARQG